MREKKNALMILNISCILNIWCILLNIFANSSRAKYKFVDFLRHAKSQYYQSVWSRSLDAFILQHFSKQYIICSLNSKFLASTLNSIVIQIRKANRENDYCFISYGMKRSACQVKIYTPEFLKGSDPDPFL